MLIDYPLAVVAASTFVAAASNLTMLKVSPGIARRFRHALTGIGPSVGIIGGYVGLNNSVVASGTDLIVLGAAAAAGLAGAIGSTWYVTPERAISRR